MEELKDRVHKAICPTCNGNGYIRVRKENEETETHQCWDCDSEGEFYVYEPEVIQPDNNVDPVTGSNKLH
jgi:DnaJ-class molecular chaperone